MRNRRPLLLIVMLALVIVAWSSAVPAPAIAAQMDGIPASLGLALSPGTQSPKGRYVAGEPLPRIVCPENYEAFVYASGLRSAHGLAFDPQGVLHVAEERLGRVSRIDPEGGITPVIEGLAQSQGITFDPAGNLYVMEDVQDGRLLRVGPLGEQTVLATNLDAPEGVVWSPDGNLYITESNVQFVENLPWDVVTRVSRVAPDGEVTTIVSDTVLWSYSAITLGADGLLYVANEASNVATTDSVFRVDPATGDRTVFTSDLTSPEGLAFAPGGQFPLFVTEEDLGDGHGRLNLVRADGTHMPLCTGFDAIEDVISDAAGNLYVSEDVNGLIVQIIAPDLVPPRPPQNLSAVPADWTATNAFTITWENPPDPSGIEGVYLKLDAPPVSITDGMFYAGQELTQVAGIAVPWAGAHPAFLWLQDGAGNTDHTNPASVVLRYDPDPPGSPANLAADPGNWTPADVFSLTWANPPELSGVQTACYQLGTSPVDAADPDACQTGTNIETITGVTVTGDGQQPAYVWLADAAGNTNPTTAVGVTLRHDALPPGSAAKAPPTARTAPIRVTWVATDTHSGLERVRLWVKMGDDGTWADSDLPAQLGESGSFLYPPRGAGTYYFATLAVDRAGNAEEEPRDHGDARTVCETWQRAYLPLVWKDVP